MSSWQTGIINVPAGAGSVHVDTDDVPAVVVLMGANWLIEDAPLVAAGPTWFRGIAARKWDDPGTILQNASAVKILGDAHWTDNHAVIQLDDGGSIGLRYRADISAMDATGFTLSFDTGASGYKIVYAVLTDVEHAGAFVGAAATTLALGWRAEACLLQGAWAGPSISGTDRTQEFFGGGAFPLDEGATGAGTAIMCFPTAPGGGQYVEDLDNLDPASVIATGGHFTGPFLITSNIHATPTGTGELSFTFSGDSEDGGIVAMWSNNQSRTGRTQPGTVAGDQAVVSGLPFAPALILGYAIGHTARGQGSAAPLHGHGGISLVSEETQWSCLVDVNPVQSFQRGFIDNADSPTSWHAGTVELTGDGFIMTTVEDSATPQNWVWHAFGEEIEAPGFFRVIKR